MFVISLTSIPPRFPTLGPTLECLLGQRPRPAKVILNIPRHYRRFPEWGGVLPAVPDGIEILRYEDDLGPATKILPVARILRDQGRKILYCDDDWHYGAGWARTFLRAADEHPGKAITGAGYNIDRIRKRNAAPDDGPKPGFVNIAQGFSGVLIEPGMLDDRAFSLPDCAWPVDDIWISGILAYRGVEIHEASGARALIHPRKNEQFALQDAVISGLDRVTANRACVSFLQENFGIWL